MREPTPREEAILEALRRAKTNNEIASDLGLSVGKVKQVLSTMTARFGAKNRVDLALWAERRHVYRHVTDTHIGASGTSSIH